MKPRFALMDLSGLTVNMIYVALTGLREKEKELQKKVTACRAAGDSKSEACYMEFHIAALRMLEFLRKLLAFVEVQSQEES